MQVEPVTPVEPVGDSYAFTQAGIDLLKTFGQWEAVGSPEVGTVLTQLVLAGLGAGGFTLETLLSQELVVLV